MINTRKKFPTFNVNTVIPEENMGLLQQPEKSNLIGNRFFMEEIVLLIPKIFLNK